MTPRRAILLGLTHLAACVIHDVAHLGLDVLGSPGEVAYVLLVIHLMPAFAVVLLWRGQLRGGFALLVLGLAGSLFYSTYAHFIAASQDHVAHLPEGGWTPVFQASALAISVIDLAGVFAVLAAARNALVSPRPHLLLIDGTCVFCNRLVSHILSHDERRYFRFAHLQSDYAQALLRKHGATEGDIDGIYVVVGEGTDAERLYVDGGAGRVVWPRLHWLATPLLFVPTAAFDPFYVLISRIRYRMFGRYDVCRVPSAEERSRFLS